MQIGMRHLQPKLALRKTLETPIIVKAEVPGMDDSVGLGLG